MTAEPLSLEAAVATLDLADADAVADLLRREGITGTTGNCRTCPLAVYLSRVTGRDVNVGATEAWSLSVADDFRLPAAARMFISRHDAGRYPDLIESP